jgi:methyl-accepting chemotaxis protein
MTFISRLAPRRIAHRLTLGYGLILVMLLIMAAAAVVGNAVIQQRIQKVFDVDNARADAVVEMMRDLSATALGMRNLSVINNPGDLSDAYVKLTGYVARYDADVKRLESLYREAGATAEEKRRMADVAVAAARARSIFSEASATMKSSETDEMAIGIRTELRRDLAKWNDAQQAWIDQVISMRDLEVSISKKSYDAVMATLVVLRIQFVVMILLALVLGTFAAWKTTRGITVPLNQAVRVAERIASGHLGEIVCVEAVGEPGRLLQSLERMRQGLHKLAAEVRVASDNINTSSSEIASANMNLSERTERAASTLQSTATSITHLERALDDHAQATRQAVALATDAASEMSRAGHAVQLGVERMGEISEQSKRIGEITSVINNIAFQTNVLALNASVEAARAGDRGRGFSVVADEVRSLAQKCATAAREISEMVSATSQRVADGAQRIQAAGKEMESVLSSVRRVDEVIHDISQLAANQQANIKQISETVRLLDLSTQQNAAMVEQAAAAAGSLREQACGLTEIVSNFHLA